jgi:hypothetical protein
MKVEWFYSKEDIDDEVGPKHVKELDRLPFTDLLVCKQPNILIRFLKSSAKQELYASNNQDLIISSEIAGN